MKNEKISIELHSVIGTLIKKWEYLIYDGDNTFNLNLEGIKPNTYFLRVQAGTEYIYKKLIVN